MRFNQSLVFTLFIFLVIQNRMMLTARAQETPAGTGSETLTFHGQLRNETAYRYDQPSAFTKILNLAYLEARYTPSSNMHLTALVRSYYDAVYDFESVDSVVPRNNPRTILTENLTAEEIEALNIQNSRSIEIVKKKTEVREFYLDLFFPKLDLRLGKQIVRWGVVEGARVNDVVNPQDFQEFILRGIQDRYIPVWMIKADFYSDPNTLEVLWIPDLHFNKPAPRGSEWEEFQNLDGLKKPPRTFENSIWGIKATRPIAGWDFSLVYLYTWDDFPSAFRTVFGLGQFGVSPDVTFNPRYHRLDQIGTNFTKGFGAVVINGEAAYVHGKMFGTRFGRFNPTTTDQTLQFALGEIQRDYAKYALSVDFRLFGADLSFQVQQQYIFAYQPEIIQDRLDTFVAAFIRRELAYSRVLLEMLTIYYINEKDTLIRPKVTYRLNDDFKIAVGADVFSGSIGGPLPGEFHFIGFFKNNDRVYIELTYSF
ncbi:MAG: hypothetical protein HY282_11825 [Nitrospirae bacterium]|nr:hypothetical protein [Candidatus Manganitrophaceae bacterium]